MWTRLTCRCSSNPLIVPAKPHHYTVYFFSSSVSPQTATESPAAATTTNGKRRPYQRSTDTTLYELSREIHQLAKAGKIEQAEALFTELWNYKPANRDQSLKAKQIGLCTQQLFLSYRKILDVDIVYRRRQRVVNSARALFKRVEKLDLLNDRRSDARQLLLRTLVDIYARAGQYEEAENLVKQNQELDATLSNILLKGFGKRDPVRANEFLVHLLQSENVQSLIDIQSFNTVISALANSSVSDKYERALVVFELMERKQYKPDNYTYAGLLLCLSKSVPNLGADAAQHADNILDQIDRQRRQDLLEGGNSTVDLNTNIYNLAMKVFLLSGDQKRAKYLMEVMEKSKKFDLRTYSEILNSWSRAAAAGVPDAAGKAEQVLEHLKNLSKSRPDLKPSTYQYTIVMTAWKNSAKDDEVAAQRIWKLYKDMENESVPLSIVTFTLMMKVLTASMNLEMLAAADQLLKQLEQKDVPSDLRPDYRHFLLLITAYVGIGDADKATEVLLRSIQLYKITKNVEILPNAITIDRVVNSWRRQKDFINATLFVEQVLKEYNESSLQERPNQRTISGLIEYWRKSFHPERRKYMAMLQTAQGRGNAGETNQTK